MKEEEPLEVCAFCSESAEEYSPCELCGKIACPEHSIFIHVFETGLKRVREAEGVAICEDHWADPLPAKLLAILRGEVRGHAD